MKRVAIGLALAALAAGGAVLADNAMDRGGHGMRMMDANGDGEVTRAEAQAAAEQRFVKMDVNKDGKLDPADRAARQAAHFDAMDTNKDGQISRAEFDSAHAMGQGGGMGGGMGEHRMGENRMGDHQMGDHKMDGRGMGHRGHGRGGMMMLRMADANKDGAVSQAEMTATALAHFDRADSNRDGKLTSTEMQAAHAAMREQMRAAMPNASSPAAPPAKTN